jgi:hypothetical protein
VLRKLFSRSVTKAARRGRSKKLQTGNGTRMVEAYDLIFMDQHMASTEKQMLGTETVRAC